MPIVPILTLDEYASYGSSDDQRLVVTLDNGLRVILYHKRRTLHTGTINVRFRSWWVDRELLDESVHKELSSFGTQYGLDLWAETLAYMGGSTELRFGNVSQTSAIRFGKVASIEIVATADIS